MALSNSQYDAIMREYGKQQMENQHSQEARKKEIYQKVPAVKELEAEIAERSVACARKLLEGNQEAIYELREKLADLKEQKALLIKAAGYSDDYLELHYRCKDCRDTGWVDDVEALDTPDRVCGCYPDIGRFNKYIDILVCTA